MLVCMGTDCTGHIVAEGDEVYRIHPHDLLITLLYFQFYAIFLKEASSIGRIITACLHIGKDQTHALFIHGFLNIIRVAAVRNQQLVADHAAHLGIRDDLMAVLRCQCACHKLVVGRLPTLLLDILTVFFYDTGTDKQMVFDAVDLVEGQPVFYFIFIPLEAGGCKFHIEIDKLAVCPAAVFYAQSQRHFIVRQRNHRLDAVLGTLIKYAVIERQTRLIGFCFIAARENACPCNGHPVALEPHFPKQADILLVVVVEIVAHTLGIIKFGIRIHGFLDLIVGHHQPLIQPFFLRKR